MEKLKKIFKVIGFSFLGLFIVFAVYANWEEPSLSDRLNIKPIELVVFNLNHEVSTADSLSIADQLTANKGVTASTVNRQGKTVSVTYHADETSEKALREVVESADFQPQKVDFTAFKGPQCPVPSEYIDFVLNAKKALCIR
ncbi:MAG: hypothetical protein V4585_14495 [Bacteroidota bacterium]